MPRYGPASGRIHCHPGGWVVSSVFFLRVSRMTAVARASLNRLGALSVVMMIMCILGSGSQSSSFCSTELRLLRKAY
ncbi:hypothetical protein BDW71DRAFT_187916 [Aspergillus fruticulosus]